MVRKINLNNSPESHCPRFEFCSINKCPLNSDFQKLEDDSIDWSQKNKEKCTNKVIRKEIGKTFGLKQSGLTNREYSNMLKSNSMREL